MTRRILTYSFLVALLLFLGLAGLLATSEVQQTGVAAGVRYELANTGLQGYSFAPRTSGFAFEQRTWFGLGRLHLEVAVEGGRLLINHVDCGRIQVGEKLTVTSDSRVLLNDRELAP